MRIHVDGPWSYDVREYGAPMRAYIHFRQGMLMVGLLPWIKGQRQERNGTYGNRWGWITWHRKNW